ncbi:uncharacterized protein FTOL_01560 [Fusarium torulosum]|uniref:Uncharacterized protein n=1 Tax=Fusarium torulosum TaxID=33205 RepID=A0AAE8M086_9HYPO|nr:uncharacterized protein FTOL_01560 [Fusarium torulosum]
MLRPHLEEDIIWGLRPWLMHWYEVADALFEKYGIFATSPDPDWFMRPFAQQKHSPKPVNQPYYSVSMHHQSPRSAVSNLSPLSALVADSNEDHVDLNLETIPASRRIVDWFSRPSEMIEIGNDAWQTMFDPTPGGVVFRSRRHQGTSRELSNDTEESQPTMIGPTSGRRVSISPRRLNRSFSSRENSDGVEMGPFQFNPCAKDFMPRVEIDEEDMFESMSDCSTCSSVW